MDAKSLVNEMVGDPGEIAKFVKSALPDLSLNNLVSVTDHDDSGGWIVSVKGVQGEEGFLGLIQWHNFEDEHDHFFNHYFIDPEAFVDDFMTSPDWEWKSGAKWVKRAQRAPSQVYYDSMLLAKRALLKEPMVAKRIARLTNLTQPAVESITKKTETRDLRLDRIVDHLENDGWKIVNRGYHTTGRAFVIGTGPYVSTSDIVESVGTAADCSHLFIKDIQSARRSVSSPWQIDFSIIQDNEEDTVSPEELSDIVLDPIPGIRTRKFLRRIHLLLKAKLPSVAVTVGHAVGHEEAKRKLFVSFGISDHYPVQEPKTTDNFVSSSSCVAAVSDVISELGILPYGASEDTGISIKPLHPATGDGYLVQVAVEGPEDYCSMPYDVRPHWTIDESVDVSMFKGVIKRGFEKTPGFLDAKRLHAIRDALTEAGFKVHEVWQKPAPFYTPTQARQIDVSVIFSWQGDRPGWRVEADVIDAFYDKDVNYRSSLYFTTIFDRPNTGLVSFYCSSYDEPDSRRALHFTFDPAESLNEEINESKQIDDFMQYFLSKWRVGKHVWGSGAVTYYLFNGVGDKAPTEQNRYEPIGPASNDKASLHMVASYMNWLEKTFMPSEKFPRVGMWLQAAELGGKSKEWKKLKEKGKAPIEKVSEGRQDLLRSIVRAAMPIQGDLPKLSALSHALDSIGCRRGIIGLKHIAFGDYYIVSVHGHIGEPPGTWKNIYQDAALAIYSAIEKAFPGENSYDRSVFSAVSGEGVGFYVRFNRPARPGMMYATALEADIGGDAQYVSKYQNESLSPAELVDLAIPDFKWHKIMQDIAKALKDAGAKGTITLSIEDDDDLAGEAPKPRSSSTLIDISASLAFFPASWRGAVRDYFAMTVWDVLQRYPELGINPPPKMGLGGEGAGHASVFVSYTVPGIFVNKRPKRFVIETLEPGELYRRSLIGSKIDTNHKMQAVAHKLHLMRYIGIVHLRKSLQWHGTNFVIFRMYKRQTVMDGNVFIHDVSEVWKEVWGEERTKAQIAVRQESPVDWLPHHMSLSFVSDLNGFRMDQYASYGFLFETMDPAALYKKSIEGTHVEGVVMLNKVAAYLAGKGYAGYISVGPGQAGVHHCFCSLRGSSIPYDTTISDVRQQFYDALREVGKNPRGVIDIRSQHDDDGTPVLRAWFDTWAWPGAWEHGVQARFGAPQEPPTQA